MSLLEPEAIRPIREADEVTDEMLALVGDCLDGWFDDDEPLSTEDFVDRFSDTYLVDFNVELDNYDSPAARKILREARKIRSER